MKKVLNDTLKPPQLTAEEKESALRAFASAYAVPQTIKEVFHRYRIGIYSATIVGLLLLIFLLAYKIDSIANDGYDFVVLNEFTADVPDDLLAQMRDETKKDISDEVDQLIRNAQQSSRTSLRNVAVDANQTNRSTELADSKGIGSSVYDEARQLQDRIDATRRMMQEEQEAVPSIPTNQKDNTAQVKTYEGPSVLSWSLEGRRALSMPIPAYKCKNGGDVTVLITVNPQGYVVDAEIDTSVSSFDPDLQREALQTAKRSRFAASQSAPKKQEGKIVYRFVAQ